VRRVLIFLAVLAISLSPAFSQSTSARFVAVESMNVQSSSWFFARTLGTLRLGEEVALIRDNGKWSEIRAGRLTGWVVSAGLSPRPTIRAASSVTPGELALAGKGFGQEVELEYRTTGLDYSRVDEMETFVIPMEELRQFIIEGRLSGSEQ